MRKITGSVCLWGILLLITPGSGLSAEAIDNQALLEEIRALRAKVAEMDAMKERLAELEALVTARQPQPAATAERPAAATTLDEDSRPMVKEVVEEVFAEKRPIAIGGALRFNYGYTDWNIDQDEKYGDAGFDIFRLNVDGALADWILSAEYRFYSYQHTIHHGFVGYNVNDNWQVQAGIHQVPFGLLPYASHNFWFSSAFYVGLEDDYDLGIKGLYQEGPWNLALAFYKNDELGSSTNLDRYSIDVVSGTDGNEETNQFNGRLAYLLDHGSLGETEVGVSGQWGQLYNNQTRDMGDRWAGALHLNGNYGNWNLQLEYAAYAYNPENPPGFDDDIIHVGGYATSWPIPAEADIGIVNVAYTFPLALKWLDSITLYSDNTIIAPAADNQPTSWQNVIGALFASGPVYTYLDVISSENMIFSEPGSSMVDESVANNDERNTRFNLNVGYYW